MARASRRRKRKARKALPPDPRRARWLRFKDGRRGRSPAFGEPRGDVYEITSERARRAALAFHAEGLVEFVGEVPTLTIDLPADVPHVDPAEAGKE